MSEARYETFQDVDGEHRWRLRAANGEIVAASEAYTTKADAERGAADAANASREAIDDGPASEPAPAPPIIDVGYETETGGFG